VLFRSFFLRERKRIRGDVGRLMRIRNIPELTFVFDPSVEHGIHIEQLLNEIKNEPPSE
jgi:ribosome-binding factor A